MARDLGRLDHGIAPALLDRALADQLAVDAVPDFQALVAGLEMQIGGAFGHGVAQDRIEKLGGRGGRAGHGCAAPGGQLTGSAVRKITSSVRVLIWPDAPKARPKTGISPSSGTFCDCFAIAS